MLLELLAAAAAGGAVLPPAPPPAAQATPAAPEAAAAPPALDPPGRWFAGLGRADSALSRGATGHWQRHEAWLGRSDSRGAATLSGEWQRRFGRRDLTLQLRGDRAWGRSSAYLAVLATPAPDFSERWGLRAGGEAAVAAGLDIVGDARLSDYASGATQSLALGGRLWFAGRRASARLRGIALWDENGRRRHGWASDAAAELGERLRVTAAYARYPETEAGVTRTTRTLAGGAAWRASERFTVRGSLEREDRSASYRRDTVALSLGFDL